MAAQRNASHCGAEAHLTARLAAAVLFVAVSIMPLAAGEILAGRASVIDGDTIEIHGKRIRLFGIDAPEARQTCWSGDHSEYRCGQKAALVLQARIGAGVVSCERKDTDQYGRTVATCRVFGEDLGAWMVGLGWAVASRTYSARYVPAEDLARRRKAGLWAGSFSTPADWRRDHPAR